MLPTMPGGAYALMVVAGLWIALWRTRWRRWGLAPLMVGAAWALATPAPDLIVTGDGRHLALRTPQGELAILRGRAGDYVRSMLLETSGQDTELLEVQNLPSAACSADLCAVDIARGGRSWRLLATRSSHLAPWREMIHACSQADIIVADRRLPKECKPRWLKADRELLRRTGGLAIRLGVRPQVSSVSESVGSHPWAPQAPQPFSRAPGLRDRRSGPYRHR
jgi:competence protein ComEC